MRLYSGTSGQFVQDTVRNQIAGKLKGAFFAHYRYNPPPSEVTSWQNSLRAMALLLQDGDLLHQGVLLEYQLPFTSKRLDFMVTGGSDFHGDPAHGIEPGASVLPESEWTRLVGARRTDG